MSINTAMAAGASGLKANASALAAISDNISNSNTVGYKRFETNFSALLNAQNQGTTYNAGGVLSQSFARVSQQGSLQSTGISTHLAIAGEGFFAVRERALDASDADPLRFTRAGNFNPDGEGFLRNSSGFYLYGLALDPTDTASLSAALTPNRLEPVRISNLGGAAEATTNISMSVNLRSSQPISPQLATYDAATQNMASGAVTPDFQTAVQIYDSQGGVHTVTLSFLRSNVPNQWNVEAHMTPPADVQTGAGLVDGQVAVGVVAFTPLGQFDEANTTLPLTLDIGASATAPSAGQVSWATGLGVAAQSISLDIGANSSATGFTQYDTDSSLTSSQVDGRAYGEVSSIEMTSGGFVRALFSNGLSRDIYRIPLAKFTKPDGLAGTEGGVYRAGQDAGPLVLKMPTEAGAGRIQPLALEASTVDLSEEFSSLITVQRAYSASSKIITTADEMLDELIRMKR
jgi:flagellar hook protein FlgE